jgi:hypothetical protein
MPSESTRHTPDLFSTVMVRDAFPVPTKQVPPAHKQRYLLPKDLPTAVKHLSDWELDLLITESLEEAKRRGRLPPRFQANTSHEPVSNQLSSSKKRQAQPTPPSLTRAQVSAVRASLKAGITPSRIARQFGISQSDIRKVSASVEGR